MCMCVYLCEREMGCVHVCLFVSEVRCLCVSGMCVHECLCMSEVRCVHVCMDSDLCVHVSVCQQ